MTIKRKARCLSLGLALTFGIGAPAVGDDTELLLITPPNLTDKPNIMFILDSSGSMNSLEHVSAFYDSAETYGGTCDNSVFYWSDSGTIPSCADNNRIVNKSAFVCDKADRQVAGVGSYTGILAQYRTSSAGGDKWQTIRESESAAIVECEEDSGIHGDGALALVYPQAGTDVTEFTDDPALEIDWGSAPVNQNYTLYDGNYLNYRVSPGEIDITRIDIVKTILGKVLTVYNDVNIGLMRFNNTQGGPVLHAISDLATNRAVLDAKLAAIDGGGNTPLSETFYEAALYWHGLPAHFGESEDEYPTDPDALVSTTGSEVYLQPLTVGTGSCPRNYNILLTDGLPTSDADTVDLAPTLPDFETVLGRTTCNINPASTNDDGQCLNDIAEYLFKHDISANPGTQTVKTFGVGFLSSKDDFTLTQEATEESGGKFFLADDPESLATSLLNIFNEITEQSLTFAAPAVAVNAFNRTQNLNDLYMTVFKTTTQAHWPGNLKKYRLKNREITDVSDMAAVDPTTGFFDDDAKSFWTVGGPDGADVELGGAANKLPDPLTRNLYTYNGSNTNLTGASNALSTANARAYTDADFGLTGARSEPSISEIIRWARGEDLKDEDLDPDTTVRNAMGDPLHSQPAAVDYGSGGTSDVVVYTATNDGYLHAFDADTGVELWSFIPKELLSDLHRLFVDPAAKYKHYGIDGDIVSVVSDKNDNGQIDGTDFVYIIFGMRRGGNNYYALDVTDKNTPKLLWNVTYPEFGQSWSAPVVARVNTTAAGLNADKAVVIIGAGYDTVHDSPSPAVNDDGEGAGIFMLDLETGNQLWRAGRDAAADLQLSAMTRAFPTRIKVIDYNGDKIADRMYAADVGGQIWRFDIFSGEPPSTLVTGGVIGQFGLDGSSLRRIYNSPDAAIFTDINQGRRYISLSIGTGYRAHPLNNDAVDRFYSLRDPDVFNQLTQAAYDSYDIATDADMIEVSGKTKIEITSADRGWKFTLPSTQKVLAESVTFDNRVFFVAFSPEVTSLSACEATVGKNFLYQVSVINGDPIIDDLDALAPADSDEARVRNLAQGGIAPSPRFLFPSPDSGCTGSACRPPPIGCVGVECFDPGFVNNPVRTLWTQDGIE